MQKVAKHTSLHSHFKLRLQVLYRSIRRLFGAIGPVESGEGLGIFVIFVVLYAIYLLLFELFLLLLFIYMWNTLAFCHLSHSFRSYSLLFELVLILSLIVYIKLYLFFAISLLLSLVF
jgi:hypothetical protein